MCMSLTSLLNLCFLLACPLAPCCKLWSVLALPLFLNYMGLMSSKDTNTAPPISEHMITAQTDLLGDYCPVLDSWWSEIGLWSSWCPWSPETPQTPFQEKADWSPPRFLKLRNPTVNPEMESRSSSRNVGTLPLEPNLMKRVSHLVIYDVVLLRSISDSQMTINIHPPLSWEMPHLKPRWAYLAKGQLHPLGPTRSQ